MIYAPSSIATGGKRYDDSFYSELDSLYNARLDGKRMHHAGKEEEKDYR